MRLYYFVRRYFNQETRSAIKKGLFAGRKRFSRLYLARHGTFTAREVVAELRAHIQDDFDILMVHSAYDRMLPMYSGNPGELVNELMAFCGPQRTLAMPAFVLGAPSYDLVQHYERNTFDVRRTISEMGLFTEVFRRKPGVKRSLHPSHSVCALGPLAEEMTANHHLAGTRMGKGTPFDVMARRRTVIVGIGQEYFRCLTQAKCVEDILGDDYPIECEKRTVAVRMFDGTGQALPYQLTIRDFAQPVGAVVLRKLLNRDELREWTFHGVNLWMTTAGRVTECLLKAAPRGITVYGRANQVQRTSASRAKQNTHA